MKEWHHIWIPYNNDLNFNLKLHAFHTAFAVFQLTKAWIANSQEEVHHMQQGDLVIFLGKSLFAVSKPLC